jgi:hypothetical protein
MDLWSNQSVGPPVGSMIMDQLEGQLTVLLQLDFK